MLTVPCNLYIVRALQSSLCWTKVAVFLSLPSLSAVLDRLSVPGALTNAAVYINANLSWDYPGNKLYLLIL